METLLKDPVQSVQPHALPFRAIFAEHLKRDKTGLLQNAKTILAEERPEAGSSEGAKEEPEDTLLFYIAKQERAYKALADANIKIGKGETLEQSLDVLVDNCKKSDEKLTLLLHSLESSALCLSGGGIRSASFSLGVLQGLSLFSDPTKGNGLMHSLDYLSTVSGGGYIGSWLISWIHQRRKANGLLELLEDAIAMIEKWHAIIEVFERCRKAFQSNPADAENALKGTTQAIESKRRILAELEEARKAIDVDLNEVQGKTQVKGAKKRILAELEKARKAVAVDLKGVQGETQVEETMKKFLAERERTKEAIVAEVNQVESKVRSDANQDIENAHKKIQEALKKDYNKLRDYLRVAYKKIQYGLEKFEAITQYDPEKASKGSLSYSTDEKSLVDLNAMDDKFLPTLMEANEKLLADVDKILVKVPIDHKKTYEKLQNDLREARKTIKQKIGIRNAVSAMAPAEAAVAGKGNSVADVEVEELAEEFVRAENSLLDAISIVSTQAYVEVISAMAGQEPVTSGDSEQMPVRHLRAYTSYLAPSVGVTLDTFTLAAIVSRNILINWVMLIPLVLALISVAKITGFGTALLEGKLSGNTAYFVTLAYLLAAVVAGVALPSHYKLLPAKLWKWSARAFVVSVIVASWLLTVWQVPPHGDIFNDKSLYNKALICAICFGALTFSIWLAYKARLQKLRRSVRGNKVWAALIGIFATLTISALTTSLLQLIRRLYPALLTGQGDDLPLFIVFALPLTITLLMSTTSLFCALLGVFELEEDREWWARCGGALLIFNLSWMLLHGIAFYGQEAEHRLAVGAYGLVLGLAGSLAGFSGATSAGPRPVKVAQLSGFAKFLEKHKLILPVVGGVSLLLIVLGITGIEENIREALNPSLDDLQSAALVFVTSLVFAVMINFAININLFSLHGMYRMRLMRAFLGASNVLRRPDPFTNFDPEDTPDEADLPACHGIPLHVINATLNLTGTRNTAWKQRRAESFTFNPVLCGGWRVGYVKTCSYGGAHGVTLATAMSISGAAFNPNMGYQSSSMLSLLMTFFNLRLGYWLPNPKRPTPKRSLLRSAKLDIPARYEAFFRKNSPTCALQPLIAEVLGNTDDDYRWIELTDGGHFENLGLYEMVMRRCKNIIVVDAGADPTCQFEDLGNAIRKIRIDLGIPIDLPPDLRMKAGMHVSNSYCSVARIKYHCVDPVPPESDGWLVYIKAGLTGREPADILQYAKTHPTFPHETTGNQFFNESQFESYRHLGSYIVQQIAETQHSKPQHADEILWRYKDYAADTNTIRAFTKAAENFWNRPHDAEQYTLVRLEPPSG